MSKRVDSKQKLKSLSAMIKTGTDNINIANIRVDAVLNTFLLLYSL